MFESRVDIWPTFVSPVLFKRSVFGRSMVHMQPTRFSEYRIYWLERKLVRGTPASEEVSMRFRFFGRTVMHALTVGQLRRARFCSADSALLPLPVWCDSRSRADRMRRAMFDGRHVARATYRRAAFLGRVDAMTHHFLHSGTHDRTPNTEAASASQAA